MRLLERIQSLSPLKRRVWVATLILLLLGGACFRFIYEWPAPWEGDALLRVSYKLDTVREDVPTEVFFDMERLGALELRTPSYRQIGLWFGGLFAGVCLVLAGLTVWWWLPLSERSDRNPAANSPGVSRPRGREFLLLALILAGAAFIRAPHLDRVIYFDEQDNLRRNYHGFLDVYSDGRELWRPASLSDALWENRSGNNPVFLSVTTQASLHIWRWLSGAERERFDIVAMRMPVFLAGLASLLAMWWLVRLWGYAGGAIIVALLGAVHPMHIDYSLQARGYAFVLLFVPLALGFATLALRRGFWRDWFGMTVSVFFCLWSYMGSFYFALALNVGILAWLLWKLFSGKDGDSTSQIVRMLAANGAVTVVYLFLMAPHIPQVSYHFRNVFELIGLQPYWVFYAWSHYSTGTNFPSGSDVGALREGTVTLAEVLLGRFAKGEPVLAFLQWAFIPAIMVSGVMALRRDSKKSGGSGGPMLLIILALVAPLLALVHQQFTSLYFYYWYLSYSLPAVLAAFAVGMDWFAGRFSLPLRNTATRKTLSFVLFFVVFLGIFIWQTWHFPGSRPGRVPQARSWPVSDDGTRKVEFRRGQSQWVTYRDGREICLRNVYEPRDGVRAGRKKEAQ